MNIGGLYVVMYGMYSQGPNFGNGFMLLSGGSFMLLNGGRFLLLAGQVLRPALNQTTDEPIEQASGGAVILAGN